MSNLRKHTLFHIIEYKSYIALDKMPVWMATKNIKHTFELY